MSKDEIKGIIITSVYFMINLALVLTSTILLYKWGIKTKHAIMFAILYCSMYDIISMIKAFFKGLFKRDKK